MPTNKANTCQLSMARKWSMTGFIPKYNADLQEVREYEESQLSDQNESEKDKSGAENAINSPETNTRKFDPNLTCCKFPTFGKD